MKTTLRFAVVMTLLTVVGGAFSEMSAQQANQIPAQPRATVYNIAFDDYCDGLTLNLYAAKGLPKVIIGGTHNNYDCLGGIHNVGGFKHPLYPGYQLGTGPVLDITFPAGPWNMGALAGQFIINTTNHTWVLYVSTDGIGNYATKTGTYTDIVPGAQPTRRGFKATTEP